jgi:hypothetical protein
LHLLEQRKIVFNIHFCFESNHRHSLVGRQNILWKNHGYTNITIYAIGQTSEMALYFEPLTSCLAAERLLMQHANGTIEMWFVNSTWSSIISGIYGEMWIIHQYMNNAQLRDILQSIIISKSSYYTANLVLSRGVFSFWRT